MSHSSAAAAVVAGGDGHGDDDHELELLQLQVRDSRVILALYTQYDPIGTQSYLLYQCPKLNFPDFDINCPI